MNPILVLGQRTGQKLFRAGQGYTDDGAAIEVLAESVAVAPAGVLRDCLFDSLYFTVTWTMGVALRLTPILDGDEITAERMLLVLAERFTDEVEQKPRSRPYVMRLNQDVFEGVRKVGRGGMRGTWFAIKVESVGGIDRGTLIVDGVSLEFDDELSEMQEAV